MRGLYAGYPEVKGAWRRVVLSLDEEFAPHLVATLLGHFSVVEPVETTTAALAEAGSLT